MRVLIGSPAFPPSLGGIERFAEQLATGLAARGDEVTVMTSTLSVAADEYPFEVLRRPGPLAKLRAFRECEVFLQANVSLRDLWPLLLYRRPWVVSHHGLYATRGSAGVLGRLKIRLARLATSRISVSRFVADRVDPGSRVIGNPYRGDLFRILEGVDRTRDVIFVGRLVSDKGVNVLLDAIALAARQGRRIELAVAGDGPEAANLRASVMEMGLSQQVTFLGRLEGQSLVIELNRSRILAMPSIVEEGFGLAALEGIASGCWVVASDSGGLREAVGSCGSIVPVGDPASLAQVLLDGVPDRESASRRVDAKRHLERHSAERVIGQYREILTASIRRRQS
jgi:glycosyltransferase involved in cell wall biosynthesis